MEKERFGLAGDAAGLAVNKEGAGAFDGADDDDAGVVERQRIAAGKRGRDPMVTFARKGGEGGDGAAFARWNVADIDGLAGLCAIDGKLDGDVFSLERSEVGNLDRKAQRLPDRGDRGVLGEAGDGEVIDFDTGFSDEDNHRAGFRFRGFKAPDDRVELLPAGRLAVGEDDQLAPRGGAVFDRVCGAVDGGEEVAGAVGLADFLDGAFCAGGIERGLEDAFAGRIGGGGDGGRGAIWKAG